MPEIPRSHNSKPGIKREFYPLPVENPTDWRCVEVHIPDGDEYLELLRTVLKSLTLWHNYARDTTHRGKVIADRFAFALQLPELGCDMNCEELLECLAPLFASVETIETAVAALAAQVEQQITTNTAQPVTHQGDCEDVEAAYGGALSVVKTIDRKLRELYALAESSLPDTLMEAFETILIIFPGLSSLGGEVMAEIANAHFESQRSAYETAYGADNFEAKAAFDLYCRVDRADCVLTNDIIGAWFAGLPALVPSNEAASVYGRFAPVNITFLNQIAAAINNSQSLESYFQTLILAFEAGTFEPAALPGGLVCSETVTYLIEPLDELLTVATYGTLQPSNYASVESPHTVTITLPEVRHIVNVLIQIASFEPVVYDVVIDGNTTNIPETYPGFGVGHDIEVIVDETSDVILIQCDKLFLIHHITVMYS